ASDHHLTHSRLADLLEHGVQGGKVAVNIKESGDPHDLSIYRRAEVQWIACERGPESISGHRRHVRDDVWDAPSRAGGAPSGGPLPADREARPAPRRCPWPSGRSTTRTAPRW